MVIKSFNMMIRIILLSFCLWWSASSTSSPNQPNGDIISLIKKLAAKVEKIDGNVRNMNKEIGQVRTDVGKLKEDMERFKKIEQQIEQQLN